MTLVADIIIIAIFMLIASLAIQKKSSWKSRLSVSTFKRSYERGFIAKAIHQFTPAKGSTRYRKLTKLIEDSFLNLDIKKLYFYKLISAICLSILVVAIVITNSQVEKMEIINRSNKLIYNMVGGELYKKIRLENVLPDVYKIKPFSMSQADALSKIQEILIIKSGVTNIPSSLASVVYETLFEMPSNIMFKAISGFFLSLAVGYWIPNVVLLVVVKIKSKRFDMEIQNLEMLLIVIGSVPNVTARDIIEELIKASNVFKPILNEFYREYLINTDEAYRNLFNKPINKDFERLMFTVRQIETSDKNLALTSLMTARESRKQSRRLLSEEWVKKKEFIALMSYLVVMGFLLKLIITPWLKEVSMITDITSMFK